MKHDICYGFVPFVGSKAMAHALLFLIQVTMYMCYWVV